MPGELSVRAVYLDRMQVLAESGDHQILTDYPLQAGAQVEGFTSLELLLASLATCSANAMMALLQRKLKQPVTGLEVQARALRREEHPMVLTHIFLEFVVKGSVDPEAVKKSLAVAEEQFCPVWNMLKGGTPISATYRIIS
jgi:uncharacterized OsmC-like protein